MNYSKKFKNDDSAQDETSKDLNEQCYEHMAKKVKILLSDK